MSEPAINTEKLSQVAKDLENQLKSLAPNNEAANSVLLRFESLINDAIQCKVDSPYKYKFFPEEFWEDGALFNEKKLAETAAKFNLLLRGIEPKGESNA
jgi:hypothetical protein